MWKYVVALAPLSSGWDTIPAPNPAVFPPTKRLDIAYLHTWANSQSACNNFLDAHFQFEWAVVGECDHGTFTKYSKEQTKKE